MSVHGAGPHDDRKEDQRLPKPFADPDARARRVILNAAGVHFGGMLATWAGPRAQSNSHLAWREARRSRPSRAEPIGRPKASAVPLHFAGPVIWAGQPEP